MSIAGLSKTADAYFTIDTLLKNPAEGIPKEFVAATSDLVAHMQIYGSVSLVERKSDFFGIARSWRTGNQKRAENLVNGYNTTKPSPFNIPAFRAARPMRAAVHNYNNCLAAETKIEHYVFKPRSSE